MEEKLYKLVAGDDSKAQLSKGIDERASQFVPQNFGRQVLASVASKIGDQLSKPGLILTWLLTALGAPAMTVGLLAPIRESGSLLPQIFVASWIRRRSIRKWFWVAGSLFQGLSVIGMGCSALFASQGLAGGLIIGLLVVFSLARGVCSITAKDLLGKTIPKKRRGRLGGLASSISGWIALVVGVFFLLNRVSDMPINLFAGLLFFAGGMWLLAAVLMSRVIEFPGEIADSGNLLKDAIGSFRMLKEDPIFLRYCISRALLASTVLSMPFYVVLAHQATGGRVQSLGVMMIASSLSAAVSGIVWGRLSDRSSRKTLIIAGTFAGVIGCVTAAVANMELTEQAAFWVYGLLFFLIGFAHTGIRNGRKTYLVDHADSGNRARLVAVSNTLMGGVLLLSGSFGLLVGVLGERLVVFIFACLGIAGGLLAISLPEVGEV